MVGDPEGVDYGTFVPLLLENPVNVGIVSLVNNPVSKRECDPQ